MRPESERPRYGGSDRLPWFPPAAPRAGGYEAVVNADITQTEALRDALGADREPFDGLVSVSTMFWMGFPDDEGPPLPGEKELGVDCFRGLARRVLKPGAIALIMTAGWYQVGHAFDSALKSTLKDDLYVIRRGCAVTHARAAGTLIDLPFYEALHNYKPTRETEIAILDEVELAMDHNNIAPDLRAATRAVSVVPTFERYMDSPHSSPFWLVKCDRAAAQKAIALSDLF